MSEINKTRSATELKKAERANKLDFSVFATKAPSNLHRHYAAWLATKVGDESLNSEETVKMIQLFLGTHQMYQASDEAKQRREDEAANRPVKTPSKVKALVLDQAAEIARLKELLAAASTSKQLDAKKAAAAKAAAAKPAAVKKSA